MKEGFSRVIDVTDSTVISKFEYNPQERKLRVHFISTDSVWEYTDVWPSEFGRLASSYSVGEQFNKSIRNTHEATRIYPERGHRAFPKPRSTTTERTEQMF